MQRGSLFKVGVPVFLTFLLISCGSSGGGSGKVTGAGSDTEIVMDIIPADAIPSDGSITPGSGDSGSGDSGSGDSGSGDSGSGDPGSGDSGSGDPGTPVSSCAPDTFAHSFELGDGTIWITQVYAIIDEIEFEHHSDISSSSITGDDDSVGETADDSSTDLNSHSDWNKRVIDLTGTDDNVPDSIQFSLPVFVNEVKLKIKRMEDERHEQPTNVADLDAFLDKIGFSGNSRVRPSIYIAGFIEVGAAPDASCKAFKFVTDRRWLIRLPASDGMLLIPADESVIHFDIEAAARAATLDGSPINASDLFGEIGVNSLIKPLGEGFLDARSKHEGFGNPVAQAWASQLTASF